MATPPHYTQRKDLFPMQGGCPCGHIRYQLALTPLLVQTCHCTLCQRQTGSAFAVNAIVESSAISLLPSAAAPPAAPLSKADAQQASSSSSSSSPCGILPAFAEATNPTAPPQTSSSSPPSSNSIPTPIKITLPTQSTIGQTQSQCPRCHAPLWNAYADLGPHGIYLLVGTLDAPWELPPDVHIFTRSSRRDFLALADGKPQFEGQYPDRAAFYRPEVKERAERLAEKQKEWRQMIRAAYKARLAKAKI